MTYVDDFLICATPADIESHRDILVNTLKNLGWQINCKKLSSTPQSSIPLLGYILHSTGPQGPFIQVLWERLQKTVKSHSQGTETTNTYCSSISQDCRAVHLHDFGQCSRETYAMQHIYQLLATRHAWSDYLPFDSGTVSDLQWWVEALDVLNN